MKMSKKYKLMSAVGGAFFFCAIPAAGQAQCLMTQDCEALGYTEASCPDGGIKCPFGDNWACTGKKVDAGLIGDFYYCEGQIVGIKVPGQSFAIAMNESRSNWNSANSYCTGYRFCGASYGRLPTKDELSAIYNNITYLQEQLQKNGGQQFTSGLYWSSSLNGNGYWIINLGNGSSSNGNITTPYYVRPVLAF